MSLWNLGLRNKALMGLLLAFFVALAPGLLIGWNVMRSVQSHLGEAFALNLAELNRHQIMAPILRELTLSQRLAQSHFTQEFLSDEQNTEKAQRFFIEAGGYREAFRDQAYFIISNLSYNYYFNDAENGYSRQPRYQLNPESDDDTWFFNLQREIGDYNINVNPDAQLRTTRIWINVPVRAEGRLLGLVGTGLDLTRFIQEVLSTEAKGVTPMMVDAQGNIQAHPDADRIAYGSGAGVGESGHSIFNALDRRAARQLEAQLAELAAEPDRITLLEVPLDGATQLLAIAYMPELDWYLLTAVNLDVAEVVSGRWWVTIALGTALIVALFLFAVAFSVERILIRPLSHLQRSATAIADGRYEVDLPPAGKDEIGDLARAFDSMVRTVQSHTQELESKVKERTRDLENSNREIVLFNKMVNDSIDYASLIQRAILPDANIRRVFGDRYFVLWQPRDTVGGDFYFFHSQDGRHLMGLVDCAGHGVPGALMTMLSRAAFDHAIREQGLESPAQILHSADLVLRNMLQDFDLPRGLATNMDAGLVLLDPAQSRVVFSGAKLSLYVAQGERVEEFKGDGRALVARKPGDYRDVELSDRPGQRYYLSSDGYLDQAGGALGYGMGNSGLIEALCQMHDRAIADHGQGLQDRLQAWKGNAYEQRDDICVMGFEMPATNT
jgi:sigma-B regulation protein RsbU (phosphoserine phosphatase)